MSLLDQLGKELGKPALPPVHVGDTVQVHYLIKEGDKERVQIFKGTVLAITGRGIAKSITVRRIVQGEGVERTFPLHSPRVHDVTIDRRGKVHQARLYYLRDRVGKKTRVAELVGEKVRAQRKREEAARRAAEQAHANSAHPGSAEESGADSETNAATEPE